MKLTNYLCDTFGTDKLLHFAFGALVPAILLPFGTLAVAIGATLVSVLAAIKEIYLDQSGDSKDFLASIAGAALISLYSMLF